MHVPSSRSRKTKGQGLVEYALILVLVAIVVIGALMILGPIIGNTFSTVNKSLVNVGSTNTSSNTTQSSGCASVYPDGYATGAGYGYQCYSPSKAAANNGFGGYNIP